MHIKSNQNYIYIYIYIYIYTILSIMGYLYLYIGQDFPYYVTDVLYNCITNIISIKREIESLITVQCLINCISVLMIYMECYYVI